MSNKKWRALFTTVVGAVLLAGCGGSGSSANTASRTTTTSAVAALTTTTASTKSTTPVRSVQASGLAFAACMRANGVTNFPDPKPGSGAAFQISSDTAAPAFRAAQTKCAKLLPANIGLPGSGAQASAATMRKLVRIADCMRRHGIAQFPDPRTSAPKNPSPGEYQEITDFDGAFLLFPASINLQAPAYRQALTACGAPPLGLPH